MKKLLVFIPGLCLGISLYAQKIEDIKNQLLFEKYKEARVELDKGMSNPKFNTKAEAYLLKAVIYSMLTQDNSIKDKNDEVTRLTNEAYGAFQKYGEMDPKMADIDDPVYGPRIAMLYNALYNLGQADYKANKWPEAFANFKRVLNVSDVLMQRKIFDIKHDTAGIIYAGLSAQNSRNVEEAAKYYKMIVDDKLADPPFEDPYRFLVVYYFNKKDYANFEKYKAIGQKTFPTSEYFTYDKIDFAIGLVDKFEDKIKSLEEVLAADPDNYRANELMGELIYTAFYPTKNSDSIKIDHSVYEPKMVTAFNKAMTLRPDSIDAFLFLGDHYFNKAERINDERTAHANAMKTRTKPGTAASKEDVAKRDQLDKQLLDMRDMELGPYEKAAAIFAKKGSLTRIEKTQYRNLAGKIADIYTFKKSQAKGKPADQAKFAAEEKKWNDLYDSIK